MAAIKRILEEVMEDLGIEEPWDDGAYLRPEVLAEYDRRIKVMPMERRIKTIQVLVEPSLFAGIERLASKVDRSVSYWCRRELFAIVHQSEARANRDEGKGGG